MQKLILIPGMMSDERLWAPQIEALRGEYDVSVFYYVDKNNVQDMARAILDSVDGPFAVCGTSMGGYVALEVALAAPDRVTHLGLFNTGATGDNEERRAARQEELDKGADVFARARGKDAYYATFLAPVNAKNPDVIGPMRAMALDLGYKTLVNHHTACMTRPRRMDDLGALTMPVTLVGGIDDDVTPLGLQQDIARRVSQADLIEIPDCGHVASLEQPDAVTAAIRDLMTKTAQDQRKRA